MTFSRAIVLLTVVLYLSVAFFDPGYVLPGTLIDKNSEFSDDVEKMKKYQDKAKKLQLEAKL